MVGSTLAPTLGIGRSATKEMGFASSGAMSTAVLGEKLWAVYRPSPSIWQWRATPVLDTLGLGLGSWSYAEGLC